MSHAPPRTCAGSDPSGAFKFEQLPAGEADSGRLHEGVDLLSPGCAGNGSDHPRLREQPGERDGPHRGVMFGGHGVEGVKNTQAVAIEMTRDSGSAGGTVQV
jgi:hypothetical protein